MPTNYKINPFTKQLVSIEYVARGTCGEAITRGEVCYLKDSDDSFWLADASVEIDALVVIAIKDAAVGSGGEFLLPGQEFKTSGLNKGKTYYIHSSTPGAITTTRPTTPNRKYAIGYALSTTNFLFLGYGTNSLSEDTYVLKSGDTMTGPLTINPTGITSLDSQTNIKLRSGYKLIFDGD